MDKNKPGEIETLFMKLKGKVFVAASLILFNFIKLSNEKKRKNKRGTRVFVLALFYYSFTFRLLRVGLFISCLITCLCKNTLTISNNRRRMR